MYHPFCDGTVLGYIGKPQVVLQESQPSELRGVGIAQCEFEHRAVAMLLVPEMYKLCPPHPCAPVNFAL